MALTDKQKYQMLKDHIAYLRQSIDEGMALYQSLHERNTQEKWRNISNRLHFAKIVGRREGTEGTIRQTETFIERLEEGEFDHLAEKEIPRGY